MPEMFTLPVTLCSVDPSQPNMVHPCRHYSEYVESLFHLPATLSQLRRDVYLPEYDPDVVVAWLDGEDPSIVLRIMLDVVKAARRSTDGLLPECRWVELVTRMREYRFLWLASALALIWSPESIKRAQFHASLACVLDEEHAHEGAAVEEQRQVQSYLFYPLSVYVEKVIAPMLRAEWGHRRASWKDGVARGNFAPVMSDSGESWPFSEREKLVAKLLPPQHVRVIDCLKSVEMGVVVLVDWHPDVAYTAISHTYGQDVYDVYDCGCATTYIGDGKARANPAATPCNGHHGPDGDKQNRVMNDMLKMCKILVEKGGVRYAWHDGICIAQYDEEDVKDAIMHMGWIYANAEDTVIFLHYVGQPMAPIGTGCDPIPLVARWHNRAWTFQEAVLSKQRRYCVLRGETSLGSCLNWNDFEDKLARWYVPGHHTIEIIDEADFFHSLLLLYKQIEELSERAHRRQLPKSVLWHECVSTLLNLLESGLFFNATVLADTLQGTASRESKHPGDHINSVLALAGVQEFSVPKDENVKEWTVEFFKAMGKKGLEFAVFTTNRFMPPSRPSLEETCSMHPLTWLPSLCGRLRVGSPHYRQDGGVSFNTSQIEFEVLEENHHIKLTGPLVCVPVRFYWKKSESPGWTNERELCWEKNKSQNEESEGAAAKSGWVDASVAKDISELAKLHGPDDGLSFFLHASPAAPLWSSWLSSELTTGKVFGFLECPHSAPSVHRPVTIEDEKAFITETTKIVQDNRAGNFKVLAIAHVDGLSVDDVEMVTEVGEEATAKRMDWREAFTRAFLWHKWPDPTRVEAMQKFLFRRTQVRDALTQCGKRDVVGLMLRLQEFFDFPTVQTFVPADPSERRKVGSFCASLVLPAEVLSCDSMNFSKIGFQAVVLNGDCMDSPVTKIGWFMGTNQLYHLLVNNSIEFRHLTELEIC